MSNAYFGEYTLISSLQNQFKTNNIIFDIIFGLVIAKVIQNLFSYSINDIINNIRKIRNFDSFSINCIPSFAIFNPSYSFVKI